MHGPTRVKSAGMQLVEQRFDRPIDDLLRELYDDEGLTQDQIADRIGVDVTTVRRWMERFGIRTRWMGPRSRKATV
jgi:transposase